MTLVVGEEQRLGFIIFSQVFQLAVPKVEFSDLITQLPCVPPFAHHQFKAGQILFIHDLI
jgi:hypothetical protein